MAVFTAIATAIGGFLATVGGGFLGSTLLGTRIAYAVGYIIAGGLANATAKALGVFDVPGLGPDQGVKIQLAPDTSNKIGVAYGRNFMSGPLTDIAISNQNETMHYCITLSEYVEGATYTVNQIFRDSALMNFASGNATVQSITQQNTTTDKDYEGKIRVRVYAGGTAAGNQIFPTSGTAAATTMMPHWTNTTDYSMEDLVFAMIEIDYDADVPIQGLGGITFDVTNSISNPGDVLIDYLNNDRYGCGLSNTIIDVNSITGAANTSLKGYAAEQITYTPNTGGSATQDRWQINGYLSTQNDCSTNIQKVCQASACFFTFDTKQGKFKALPNRSGTSTFSLTDDNIVSKIGVSSTELYSLFNGAEIEFPDVNRRDEINSTLVSTPVGDRNPNEPDNVIKFRLDLINDNIRSEQIGNLDLTQSRYGTVVTCETDFSGMQIDVGDIVDLTNADFGFSAKEFRVLRHQEKVSDQGMINCALTLLEYNASVYTQPAVTETAEIIPIDIPPITPPIILPPIIYRNIIPNVTDFTTDGSGTGGTFTIFTDSSNSTYRAAIATAGGSGHVVTDVITISGVNLMGVAPTNNLTMTVDGVSGGAITLLGNVSGNAVTYNEEIFGGVLSREAMGSIAVGGQIEDKPGANLSNNGQGFSNTSGRTAIIPVRELDLLNGSGLEPGSYSFMAAGAPIGTLTAGGDDFQFVANVNIEYANGFVQNQFFGTAITASPTIPSTIEANKKITIGPDPVSGNVVLEGENTMAPAGGNVGFSHLRYDMVRLTKGDVF
tara:strand:+ start:988 stop:3318 length:2331 start_codon:yes stop_codon:yes gene_type:complete